MSNSYCKPAYPSSKPASLEAYEQFEAAKKAVVSDVAGFLNQVNPNRPRPVKLQVNTSGAWRDVISFDAGKDVECAEAMSAAETLGRISGAKFRVVIKGALQTPLMHWTRDAGWVNWK